MPTPPPRTAGHAWPALPRPGQLVRLPLPFPPMLLEALGCETALRHVVLWWGGGAAGEVFWTDGLATATADAGAWEALTRHNLLCRVIFESYDLADDFGAPTWDPPHRLVADRREGTLDVALADDVPFLLATEPPGRGAGAELSRRAGASLRGRPGANPATAAARRAELTAHMRDWLDATLDWVDTTLQPGPGAQSAAAPAHQL